MLRLASKSNFVASTTIELMYYMIHRTEQTDLDHDKGIGNYSLDK